MTDRLTHLTRHRDALWADHARICDDLNGCAGDDADLRDELADTLAAIQEMDELIVDLEADEDEMRRIYARREADPILRKFGLV